jgi:predicted MPP superfamily phosphohydrolase
MVAGGGAPRSKLTILHLSDAHWSEKNDHPERVLNDLAVMKERGVKPDLVIFSVDVV